MTYLTPPEGNGSGEWPFCRMCRLIADSREELQAFGRSLRLKDEWLHVSLKNKVPHYCLDMRERQRAIKHGAKELSKDGVRLFIQHLRRSL